MPVRVSCHACSASFRIRDALYTKHFAGRQGKIWCKKCKALIVVDGTHTPAAAAPETESLSTPPRNLSPTSLRAVTIEVDEQWPTTDELESLNDIATSAEPSETPAADPIDHTPTPVPVPVPPQRASLRPVRDKRRLEIVAVCTAVAASVWLYMGQEPAKAPAITPVVAATPVEHAIQIPAAAPEPAIAAPVVPEPEPAPAAVPEPEASKPSHDEAALNRTLGWAVGEAENCHKGGRAAGTAHVTVRFAPSGRVRSAVIAEEAIQNAPVGRCIVAFMKAMVIPAFQGAELEIAKEIELR